MNSKSLPNRNIITPVQTDYLTSLSRPLNSDLLISVIIPVYNEENSIKDIFIKTIKIKEE